MRSSITEQVARKKSKNRHQVADHCFFMLPFTKNPEVPEAMVQQLDLQGQEVHQANRMIIDTEMYHSLAYSRKGNSCSFIVQFKHGCSEEFGKVRYYLLARDTGFVILYKCVKRGNICSFSVEEEPNVLMVQSCTSCKRDKDSPVCFLA